MPDSQYVIEYINVQKNPQPSCRSHFQEIIDSIMNRFLPRRKVKTCLGALCCHLNVTFCLRRSHAGKRDPMSYSSPRRDKLGVLDIDRVVASGSCAIASL